MALLLFFGFSKGISAEENADYTEKTPQVEYNWGLGGPNGLVDNFTAHFDQSQNLDGGDYFLQTLADDGIKVSVNGTDVINRLSYSHTSLIDRAVLKNTQKGLNDIQTSYREGVKTAYVFSHVVPFDDWLGYFYSNQTTGGSPEAAKIMSEKSDGRFVADFGKGSPATKVPADGFSARYVTAKNLDPGDYIIRVGSDSGVQVLLDGKTVINSFGTSAIKDEAVKVNVKNGTNGDRTHWIEVRYKHISGNSKMDVQIQPYKEVMDISPSDGWVGEVYSGEDFKGKSIILGGKNALKPLKELNLNWGSGSPHPWIPNDNFTAKFYKKWDVASTDLYSINVSADDGVRVYVDGEKVIDSWKYVVGGNRTVTLPMTKGIHDVRVEYLEKIKNARIKVEFEKKKADYTAKSPSLKYNWGLKGPIKDKYDHFTAKFDQSQDLKAGNYFVQTYADDGLIMEVDGKTIIDRWKYSPKYIDRALLPGMNGGKHSITTLYNEGTKSASIFSNIVPYGDWLAYYYGNENFSGAPLTSKVIQGQGSGNKLNEVNGQGSPVPGVVPVDHFSALYTSAMKLEAGDYVLRTGADDGLQVYIDGKLVLDRFTPVGYREDDIKFSVSDNGTGTDKDVHWVEVKYREGILSSRVNVQVQPYKEVTDPAVGDGWVGEVYPTMDFNGTPIILGGKSSSKKIENLDYNWGQGSPSPLIPNDYFSTRFKRKVNISDPGYYVLNAWADDGVRVYVDGKKMIDSWGYQSNHLRQAGIDLTKGEHEIIVEHFDKVKGARLKFELEKGKTYYEAVEKQVSYNWGLSSPSVEVQPDNFTALFNQSQYLAAGDYFFQTMADDGVKVDFDGKRIIDRWNYSYDSLIDRALLTGVSAGNHSIMTNYREGVKTAYLFSHVVPFNDWLAYYYTNETVSGSPAGSKVIKGSGAYGALSENNGYGSPMPGVVPVDHFSAKYVTAKRVPAGEYIVRGGADDGIQVLIDGEMVLDRFTNGAYREDAVKVNIKDRAGAPASERNVHWIEVRYKESTDASKIDFVLQPYNEAKSITKNDGWFAEFFSNESLSGPSVIMGGKGALVPLNEVNFNWGQGSPSPLLPVDHFSARLTKKLELNESGDYVITVYADDGLRLKMDGKTVIDSWSYVAGGKRQVTVPNVSSGVHDIEIEYHEGTLGAKLQFDIKKVSAISYRDLDLRKPSNITAQDIVNFFNKKNRADSTLKQYAQDFINVQNKTGVNAQYLVAHAIWETGWGDSAIAKYKRNFFGYGAYDSCPVTCAFYFPTGDDSISFVAYQVKTDYLTPGGRYYNGPNLDGMNVRYATDQNWKNGIANLMESIKPFDAAYYDRLNPSTKVPATPPTYGRDIPSGQPYPSHIFLDYSPSKQAILTSNTNYRSIPYESSSTILGTLNKGAKIEVLGENTDVRGSWYRVKVNGQSVWMSGTYLDFGNSGETKEPMVRVTEDGLRIRTGPSTSYSIITSVNSGTTLKLVVKSGKPVQQNGWYQVYLPNSTSTGWLSGDYVKVIN
ncbi:PA14 domain-containing protein [Rossellomorea marisflavi]|uniref:PA14 domain-containing protein n=1 Tax=Rossellomorea marisflavi TaxID=189381 RepID=UPI0027992788|nr:PA14 domain-containing protein [Rossellomorea marisflavi]UTE73359.1 PA14 domain-containing protein [Rossellomorea marisflavi]